MASDVLNRLRQVDWMGKPKPTICSQLIMPVLTLLGYGEHTLHKVADQQSYPLKGRGNDAGDDGASARGVTLLSIP